MQATTANYLGQAVGFVVGPSVVPSNTTGSPTAVDAGVTPRFGPAVARFAPIVVGNAFCEGIEVSTVNSMLGELSRFKFCST